jgi:hypothetical protein
MIISVSQFVTCKERGEDGEHIIGGGRRKVFGLATNGREAKEKRRRRKRRRRRRISRAS